MNLECYVLSTEFDDSWILSNDWGCMIIDNNFTIQARATFRNLVSFLSTLSRDVSASHGRKG